MCAKVTPNSDPLERTVQRTVTLDVQERVEGSGFILEMHLAGAPPDLVASGIRHETRLLSRDPGRRVSRLFERIANWPKKAEQEQREAARRLWSNGLDLARELIPAPIRHQLWGLRDVVTTLEVLTNERWVPWEMLAIEAPDDAPVEGERFLSELFDLTRWPKGCRQRRTIVLDHVAFLAPSDAGLAGLHGEYAPLVMANNPRRVDPIPATLTDILDHICAETFDAWHFSGHGVAPGDDPSGWGLSLTGTERLLPADLAGVRRALRAKRPWVFLNACHTSKGGQGLSGGDGLAHAFLDAGACVYVGALWAIESDVARAFAAQLYTDLLQGTPLAAAVRRTRIAVRKAFPGDPTWLAYTVYGPPMARVAGANAAIGERVAGGDSLPPVPDVPKPLAAGLGRRVRRMAIIAALCLGAWIAWTVTKGASGTPPPGHASDRGQVGASSSNVEAVQSLPSDHVDEAPVQTDLEAGISNEPPVEQKPAMQEPVKATDQDQKRDVETLPRAKPTSSPPATVEPTSSLTPREEATSSDLEKSNAVPECGPRQMTVRAGESVRIDCAALTLSILFDRQFDHEIATLRVAPDGQQLKQFPFFEHGAISPVVESPAGRWRINVLSSSRADGQVVVAVSEETHE